MKPARNQSCPCGSGKKFKRCCGQGKDHLNEVPADIYQTFQLALAHHAAGEFDRAAALYRSIIATRPLPEAYNNLGNVLKDQGNIAEATAYYQQALKLRPVYADAEYNLADTLQTERRYEDAVTHYRRALKLVPDDVEALAGYVHTLQQICDWSEINALSKRLMELIAKPDSNAIFPFALLSLPADLRLQQSNARKASRYVKRKVGTVAPAFRAIARGDRLRIGYLSADFHDHPTAYLIAELLELHDRSRFEIVGYSTGTGDGKEMRQRIAVACDEFFDLRSHSSADAAARIRGDKTHILVDLKGYTRFARTEILARRPAPVQVNYLGYPGTMGADFVDYIIADRIVIPDEQQAYFDEKCVYLPGTYQVNDRKRPLPIEIPSRESLGLPEHTFVFCCFNNSFKITPEIFSAWSRIVRAVPESVLWLFEGNSAARKNLLKEAENTGIANRLMFAPRRPLAEHLSRYKVANLFLDTFPYGAHTTASDALWMGLPVVTLAGATFASRVGASLLSAIGLSELVTHSIEQYEALAIELAQNPARILELQERLANNRFTTPLFDSAGFTRQIEATYETMWRTYSDGSAPRSFGV